MVRHSPLPFAEELNRELAYRAWRGVRVVSFTTILGVLAFQFIGYAFPVPEPLGIPGQYLLLAACLLLPFAAGRNSSRVHIYSVVVLLHLVMGAHLLSVVMAGGRMTSWGMPSFSVALLLVSFVAPLPVYWFLLTWLTISIPFAACVLLDPGDSTSRHQAFQSLGITFAAALIGVRVQISDVMEVVQVRRALRDESQRRVVADERSRIARDLHDHVGARLTGIALRAERDQRRLPKEAADTLLWTRAVIRLCLEELRDSIWALNYEERDAGELLATLRRRVEDAAHEANIKLRWASNDDNWHGILPAPVALAVNSIVRESLTNIARHSHATEIAVLLHHGGDNLLLEISDNGAGMPVAESLGRGLHNLRARAAELGGTTSITSRTPSGVSVRTWIPLTPVAVPPDDREVPWPDKK